MTSRIRQLAAELQREAARNAVTAARSWLDKHKRLCGICGRRGARPVEFCEAGWELAKELNSAQSAWRSLNAGQDQDQRQERLW